MMAALDAIIISIAAVLTAVGSLAGSLAMGAKNLAEARSTRAAAEHAARQVSPNHGSSVADAVTRIEARQKELARSVGSIRDDARADREALVALQRSADTSHELLGARIDALNAHLDLLDLLTNKEK